jgi:hypothetical protein
MRSTRSAAFGLGVLLAAVARPDEPSVRVAFLGDGGKGSEAQRRIAELVLARRPQVLFLLGDNLYGDGGARHLKQRFDLPYDALLRTGILIRPVLGNHDVKNCRLGPGLDPEALPPTAEAYDWSQPDCDVNVQLWYPRFGYPERPRAAGDARVHPERLRYYRERVSSVEGAALLDVFALDSNTLPIESSKVTEKGRKDTTQLDWLRAELGADGGAVWKVMILHHPFRTPRAGGPIGLVAGHGPEETLGTHLLKLCDRFGVDAVFAGHNHFYARMQPEATPAYPTRSFVSGGGGTGLSYGPRKNDRGVVRAEKINHFILVTLTPSSFRYEVIDRDGARHDCGEFAKRERGDRPCSP